MIAIEAENVPDTKFIFDKQARRAFWGPGWGCGHGFALGAHDASEQAMSIRTVQYLIASVFLILGGWALFAPASVIELAITDEYREDSFLTRFIMACFGAQAVLFGIMTLFVRFSSTAFLVLAILLVPFFVFDWYFHFHVPVLNSVGMFDFVGNAVMFVLCLYGWRIARAEEQTT